MEPNEQNAALSQLRAVNEILEETMTQLQRKLTNAVAAARRAGATWKQIGEAIGSTRQAAQIRFGRLPPVEPASDHRPLAAEPPTVDLEGLVTGEAELLGNIPKTTGGPAGVFTIWIRDELVWLGYSRLSAEEARPSNHGQSDGARGRLVGTRRQPPKGLQERLRRQFPALMEAAGGTEQQRAKAVLEREGRYRMVHTTSGAEASELHARAKVWLPERGHDL